MTRPEQGSGGAGERQSGRTDSLPLSHSPALRLVDYLLALASAIFAAALYLRTLAPGVLGGDSGEFQFAAWLGGFAHPTGYPLYLLLGYLWTHLLPFADAAWRMNAFSALWGAVAVGLLYLLALRMLQMTAPAGWPIAISRLLALLAAAIFAVTPTFWSQAVVAEVYTLNVGAHRRNPARAGDVGCARRHERALSRRIPVWAEPGPPPDDAPVDPGHRGVCMVG